MTRDEKFWNRVDKGKPDECWIWMGAKQKNGYGRFWNGNRNVLTHRYSYELSFGIIPKGMTIDHLCRNRGCVNPKHLEVVDMRENILRGIGPSAQNKRKTHCPRGHLLIVHYRGNPNWRGCLICEKELYDLWVKNHKGQRRESQYKWMRNHRQELKRLANI